MIARCGALRGDPRRYANERREGWEREIAEEHERGEPYNGPRDLSQPSIRDEEAPLLPHLKVTFSRSAAPEDTRPDKAVHGRDEAESARLLEVQSPALTCATPLQRNFSGGARGKGKPKVPGREKLPPSTQRRPVLASSSRLFLPDRLLSSFWRNFRFSPRTGY